MSCAFCNAVSVPGTSLCPECLIDLPVNQNSDFDPYTDDEMNEINDELLLSVVRGEDDVELKPDFVEEILNDRNEFHSTKN